MNPSVPQSQDTDTPETDAEAWWMEHANLDSEEVVSADFARSLERRLRQKDEQTEGGGAKRLRSAQ